MTDPAELFTVHSEVVALEQDRYNFAFTRTLLITMFFLFGGLGAAVQIPEAILCAFLSLGVASWLQFVVIRRIDMNLNVLRRNLYYLIIRR